MKRGIQMRNERYTEAQKLLLKIDPKTYTPQEEYIMRRSLIPRKQYAPETEEEGHLLAKQILGEKEYLRFLKVSDDICLRYGAKGEWCAGDSRWKLFYRLYVKNKALCAIGMVLDLFELRFGLEKKEMDRFEKERNTFSRAGIQWTYDTIMEKNGRKVLSFDLRDESVCEEVFRLLDFRVKAAKE